MNNAIFKELAVGTIFYFNEKFYIKVPRTITLSGDYNALGAKINFSKKGNGRSISLFQVAKIENSSLVDTKTKASEKEIEALEKESARLLLSEAK